MTTPRKIAVAAGALFALALAALILIPVLFKDRLIARLKAEINESVDARVDWGSAGLSMLRGFPNLTVRLADLRVGGTGRFQNDTLAHIGNFRLVVDLGSVVRNLRNKGPIEIRSVVLNDPSVRLIVLEDGAANWDIARPRPAAAPGEKPARPFQVGLRSLELNNADIIFDNRQAGTYARLDGLQHTMSGDFTRESFDLRTTTRSPDVTLRFAGVPYLNRVGLDVKADIAADLANRKFTFKQNEIRLNDLLLAFSGSVAQVAGNLNLDLQFEAPGTNFKSILSLVPAMYTKDFRTLETSGTVAVNGKVSGLYGDSAFPSFALRATVVNGQFRYPDLPLPARNISFDLAIDNPGGSVDSTVVNLRRFHAELGKDPVNATLVMRTPVSDPDIDARASGRVDLAELRRTIKLDSVSELTGTVVADVAVKTRMSYLDNKQYERIAASGNAGISNVTVRAAALPHPLAIQEMQLQLAPRHAELRTFRGAIGSSQVQMAGTLENLLGFVLRDQDLKGSATFRSAFFDLNEWQSNKDSLTVIPVPPRIDLALNATIDRLKYARLELTGVRGNVLVKDERITLDGLTMHGLGGEIGMSGFYDTKDPVKPTFDFDLAVTEVDIPQAFRALNTIQMLAPVARYAQGRFSTSLRVNGALAQNMMPLFDVLNGEGMLRTSSLVLQEFPAMDRLADLLKLQDLKNPTLAATRSSIEIRDGKLFVKPFDVKVGSSTFTVSGWNGIDQSLEYALAVAIPREALGAQADRFVNDLATRLGNTAGVSVRAPETIRLTARVGGTVTQPTLQTAFGSTVASVADDVKQAAQNLAEEKTAEVVARVDSAKEEARRKAQAEADALIAAAEERAAALRAEAQQLADAAKKEGDKQADALLAKATNPLAQAAARPAADRLRKEAANRADQMVQQATKRGDDLIAEARRKAGALLGDTTAVRN